MSHPSYIALLESGELEKRARAAFGGLKDCRACPRDCGADRLGGKTGWCKVGREAVVSSAFPHMGEEDPLRGSRGSGTIFYSGCNLRCRFCQNCDISHEIDGRFLDPGAVAGEALELQAMGCHNINFVTPSHVVPQTLMAVKLAAERGLRLPIVYNTSAYDSLDSLRLLDGVVDIYMPDFKLWDPALSKKYLNAEDYPERAREAVLEMRRQTGDLALDGDGLARRGVLVRHLVMPGRVDDSERIFRWLAEEVSKDTYINVMGQYHPAGEILDKGVLPELRKTLKRHEYKEAITHARDAGLHRFDERRPFGLG